MKKKNTKEPQYVVGEKSEEFCWLLPTVEGDAADDQNIELARRFDSLEEAAEAADEHGGTVFEIVDDTTWPATLEEF